MADTTVQMHRGLIRLGKGLGARVENAKGEPLGRVEDMIVDLFDGHVVAIVLSFREFFGLAEKLVAVPLAALSFDPRERKFRINIDRDMLHQAPSFRGDEWPELLDRVWATKLYAYYGYPPYWH